MACQVVGVRAKFMASQMVTFLSSMALPELGQIFTVGSMTWVIGPDSNGEIVEAVQDHLAPIAPTLATTSLISCPAARLGDPSAHPSIGSQTA
jgi:hypothetical protein